MTKRTTVLPPTDPLNGPVTLVAYDPRWPELFGTVCVKVHAVLNAKALAPHHAGSTSVPGLAAKPIIDMVLEVADSADEAAYVPALEAADFALCIREPDWFEHRLLRHGEPAANLHVFSGGCAETRRMIAFRDHLRRHRADRRLYEEIKRTLAARSWAVMQDYADAKSAVVAQIMARAAP